MAGNIALLLARITVKVRVSAPVNWKTSGFTRGFASVIIRAGNPSRIWQVIPRNIIFSFSDKPIQQLLIVEVKQGCVNRKHLTEGKS
ncbi:MAG: hypothetical protein L3J98_12685 [Gammaproteobacteria bacterium]|nr:hypothetical protein [Gammaproteobacteria bacterium]MCF6260993.1 hypothetical protein [Gammaproteobacteria bacterium]